MWNPAVVDNAPNEHSIVKDTTVAMSNLEQYRKLVEYMKEVSPTRITTVGTKWLTISSKDIKHLSEFGKFPVPVMQSNISMTNDHNHSLNIYGKFSKK